MEVKKIFKKYMFPFLAKHNFELHDNKETTYVFKHIENPELWIVFRINVKRKCMYVDIRREYQTNRPPGYSLLLFLEDPYLPYKAIGEPWYFDTEEEFLGVLEEQSKLLEEGGFDWLHGCSDYDIEKLVVDYGEERARVWQMSSEEERQTISEKYSRLRELWKKRKVKPVYWIWN